MSVKKAAKAQAAENKEKSPEGEVVREEQKVDSCRIFIFFIFFYYYFLIKKINKTGNGEQKVKRSKKK